MVEMGQHRDFFNSCVLKPAESHLVLLPQSVQLLLHPAHRLRLTQQKLLRVLQTAHQFLSKKQVSTRESEQRHTSIDTFFQCVSVIVTLKREKKIWSSLMEWSQMTFYRSARFLPAFLLSQPHFPHRVFCSFQLPEQATEMYEKQALFCLFWMSIPFTARSLPGSVGGAAARSAALCLQHRGPRPVWLTSSWPWSARDWSPPTPEKATYNNNNNLVKYWQFYFCFVILRIPQTFIGCDGAWESHGGCKQHFGWPTICYMKTDASTVYLR